MKAYLRSLADGDGQAACQTMTGAYNRQFSASYATGLPELGATTCVEVVEKLSASIGPDEVGRLRDVDATAEVDGSKATVSVSGATTDAQVQRVDGRWLITGGLDYRQ